MPYKFQLTWKTPEGSTHPQGQFWCILKCQQCMATTSSGRRCSRTTCIGAPFCWSHLRSIGHLRIKPSSIPGGGKGLYVDSLISRDPVFKAGDLIVPYHGETITEDELNRRYGTGDHVTGPYAAMNSEMGIVEDGACVRGIGSLANGSVNGAPPPNAELRAIPNQRALGLFALEDLDNGTEVIWDYGDDYRMDEPHVVRTDSYDSRMITQRQVQLNGVRSVADNSDVNDVVAPPRHWRKNLGNSCYVTSVLSLLTDGLGINISMETGHELRDYVVRPTRQKLNALLRAVNIHDVEAQHDAHEFFVSIMHHPTMFPRQSLHDALKISHSYASPQRAWPSVNYHVLSVPVANGTDPSNGKDVQGLLKHMLTRPHRMRINGNDVQRVETIATHENLVVHLIRQTNQNHKIMDFVWPSLRLQVPQGTGGRTHTYDLKAFVAHGGATTDSGHYVCVKTESSVPPNDFLWIMHDDDRVTEYTDPAQCRVLFDNGFQVYMLAYKKTPHASQQSTRTYTAAAEAQLRALVPRDRHRNRSRMSPSKRRRKTRGRRSDGDHNDTNDSNDDSDELTDMWRAFAMSRADPRVSAKNTIGVPVATLGNGVEARPSGIRGAGRGLFATRRFPKGSYITRYDGRLIQRQEAEALRQRGLHTHVRALRTAGVWLVDGMHADRPGMGGAAMANDARDKRVNNAELVLGYEDSRNPVMMFVYLRATKDIHENDEIFASYGPGYWS